MPKIDDDDLAALLNAGIRQASGYTESRLAKERERAEKFREGAYPPPLHGNNSKYVSMDVYDSVEQMKAQILEVFSGQGRPANFPPLNADDVEAAQVATDYVTDVVFNQNPGFQIFQDVIDDALMGRAGIAKVFWEEKIENEDYEMSDAALPDLQAFIAQNPDADVNSLEMDEDGETIKRVELTLKADKSQVRIMPLPPEEFLISGMSKSIREAKLVVHRQPVTASDLIKMGYDKKVVEGLQDQDESWLSTEPELVLRFQQTDDIVGMRNDEMGMKARRVILLYECYTELDLEDSGRAELYKVVLAGNTVLDKQRVSRKPFVAFVALPRAHAFWGANYAKLVIPTQAARTYLTRSIIDHSLITNNPRYGVVRGALTNPRELTENRIGGVVNVSRPDGIFALPQASLNPFVFQTINQLDQDKEQLTGISSLAQGLNKDAISTQNSGDMVNQLITVSQIRQKIVARNFAYGFLTDLYREVYQLVCENERRDRIFQVAGEWRQLDPSTWVNRDKLEVDFALGYGEADKEAVKWTRIDQYLSADPKLAPMYPMDKRFNVLSKALENQGVKDINTYLLTPAQIKPPQPDPMQQADLALKQADAAAKQAAAAATQQKMKLDAEIAQLNQQIELGKLKLEQMKIEAQIQLERDKLAHTVAVDASELVLQQNAQAQGKLTAVAEQS